MDMVIDEGCAGMEIRVLLRTLGMSGTQIKKLKQHERGIMVDGVRRTVRHRLQKGEVLSLAADDMWEDVNGEITPTPLPVDILYEDDDVIVVNKPAGMPTHPSFRHRTDTLANALVHVFTERRTPFVFRAVNRLDRDTSGVVVIARHQLAAHYLVRAMAAGEFEKQYIAILEGHIAPPDGVIERRICREEDGVIRRCVTDDPTRGAHAVTRYTSLFQGGGISVVSVRPLTGRTHQIRVHFASVGHSLCGDDLYGGATGDIARQALHAARIDFPSPRDGHRITVTAPLPDDMAALVRKYDGAGTCSIGI